MVAVAAAICRDAATGALVVLLSSPVVLGAASAAVEVVALAAAASVALVAVALVVAVQVADGKRKIRRFYTKPFFGVAFLLSVIC